MNIQINARDDITENELRYIYHNLNDIKKLYEQSPAYYLKEKYPKENWITWKFELDGYGAMGKVGRKVLVKVVNNTLYLKIK